MLVDRPEKRIVNLVLCPGRPWANPPIGELDVHVFLSPDQRCYRFIELCQCRQQIFRSDANNGPAII